MPAGQAEGAAGRGFGQVFHLEAVVVAPPPALGEDRLGDFLHGDVGIPLRLAAECRAKLLDVLKTVLPVRDATGSACRLLRELGSFDAFLLTEAQAERKRLLAEIAETSKRATLARAYGAAGPDR